MAEGESDGDRRVAALEAELRNERAQFALAERAARVGYWRFCLVGGKLTWSPGMYRLLGADPNSRAPDHTWLMSQVVPEDVVMVEEKIAAAIRTRSPFWYQTHSLDPASPIQVVETHGEVEIGPDGRVVSVIGVCHDVTKQVLAETARAGVLSSRPQRSSAYSAAHSGNSMQPAISPSCIRKIASKPKKFPNVHRAAKPTPPPTARGMQMDTMSGSRRRPDRCSTNRQASFVTWSPFRAMWESENARNSR